MPAPRHFARYDHVTLGMIGQVAYGWITAAEAAPPLGMHRATVARLCRELFGAEPTDARRAYVRQRIAKAEGIGRRPLTKAQLRKIADQHQAERMSAHDSPSK